MKMQHFLIAVITISTIGVIGCRKDVGQSELKVRMTDAPGDWEAVNVDLRQVVVKFNHDTSRWVPMQTNGGIYNLLGLQNGVDSLIADASFPGNWTVKEVRLILGNENSIQVNGQTYPLVIPSGAETGLKIKVNEKLDATIETIVIDFDAALSIQNEADGYKLRPVIVRKQS